jgi:hypothetical protein
MRGEIRHKTSLYVETRVEIVHKYPTCVLFENIQVHTRQLDVSELDRVPRP